MIYRKDTVFMSSQAAQISNETNVFKFINFLQIKLKCGALGCQIKAINIVALLLPYRPKKMFHILYLLVKIHGPKDVHFLYNIYSIHAVGFSTNQQMSPLVDLVYLTNQQLSAALRRLHSTPNMKGSQKRFAGAKDFWSKQVLRVCPLQYTDQIELMKQICYRVAL